jgi:hypothetical protein
MTLTLSELRYERFFHNYVRYVLPTNHLLGVVLYKKKLQPLFAVSATHNVKVEPTYMSVMLTGSKLSRIARHFGHTIPFLSITMFRNDYVLPCLLDSQPIWKPVFLLYAEHFFLTTDLPSHRAAFKISNILSLSFQMVKSIEKVNAYSLPMLLFDELLTYFKLCFQI